MHPHVDPTPNGWGRVHECISRLRSHGGHLIAGGGGQDPRGWIRPHFVHLSGGISARIAVIPVASRVHSQYTGSPAMTYTATLHPSAVHRPGDLRGKARNAASVHIPTSATQQVQVHLAEIDGRDEVEVLP